MRLPPDRIKQTLVKLLFFEAIVLPDYSGSSTILTRTRLINLVGENFSLAGTNCGLTNCGEEERGSAAISFANLARQDEEEDRRSNLNSPRSLDFSSKPIFFLFFFFSLFPDLESFDPSFNALWRDFIKNDKYKLIVK